MAVCNSAERARLRSQNRRAVRCGGKALPGLSLSAQRSAGGSHSGRRRIVSAKGTAAFSPALPTSTDCAQLLAPQTHGTDSPPVAHSPEGLATGSSAKHAAGTFLPTTPRWLCRWLADCRGLAAQTIVARRGQWQQFLNWLEERGSQERLRDLSVADLDAYLQFRAQSVRRSTRAELALGLRSFVAYLYHRGFLARDLSQTITGPTMYAFEGIPSALTREQIAIVVEFARKDRTPSGLRTFAIVMLLAEYGLRAGEVVCLRLEDIDWRQECLRIRHSKTGAETTLPLMPSVGDALLDYLQQARPKTAAREVFVRIPAPHVPLRTGSSLYPMIQRLLGKAGITLEGTAPDYFSSQNLEAIN